MMKAIYIFAFLLCSLSALQAQYTTPALVENTAIPKYNWLKTEGKKAIPAFSLSFIAGTAWGLHEAIQYRKDVFFKRFPGANRQYFDPSISWENKYMRPGVPVQLTDAKHLTFALNNIALSSAISAATIYCTVPIVRPKLGRKWWDIPGRILIQSAAISAGYTLGNWLTFDQLFKQ
jgi:hypothetical protein